MAVAAIERVAREGEWRSNLSQGGQPRAVAVGAAEAAAAVAAVHALGLDLGTVDVMGAAGGPVVLEVNSFGDVLDVAAFSGVDVIGAFADLVEAVASGERSLGPASRRALSGRARTAELSFCRERLASKAAELAGRRTADGGAPTSGDAEAPGDGAGVVAGLAAEAPDLGLDDDRAGGEGLDVLALAGLEEDLVLGVDPS
jgi:hypothetical protein